MRKTYLKLTEDQKKRGVIFSSQLQPGGGMHEVFKDENSGDARKKIERLLDDKFFNKSSYKKNEIRQ